MKPELTQTTATALRSRTEGLHHITAMVGFDGFVDEIIRVVNKRSSQTEYTQVESISDFAARIAAASGQSTNIELIVQQVKLGGNGPIMANALAAYGADVTCVGPLGDTQIHPAFGELATRAKLVTLGDPGHTDALEFEDGKLMLGKLQTLDDVTWDRLVERLGDNGDVSLLTASRLIALVNWTMIPAMSEIWARTLVALESAPTAERTFFFDLADPEKHDDAAVRSACQLLARFQKYGTTILGLNEKEAFRVAQALGYRGSGHSRDHVRNVATYISKELAVETVVVHPRAYALTASAGRITSDVDGPFTDNPKISTGAGDHFNAGFCIGKLAGLPDDQATTVGVGTSGYYVRNAASPNLEQLMLFLEEQAATAR
jgi:sugar/nucleoside kinase (ribokinase family)